MTLQYTEVPEAVINDPRLTLEAVGLYAVLKRKSVNTLKEAREVAGPEGRDALAALLKNGFIKSYVRNGEKANPDGSNMFAVFP